MKHLVDRDLFVDWILEDEEDFYAHADLIRNSLKKGKPLTAEVLFEKAGYIPNSVLVEPLSYLDSEDEPEFQPNIDCVLVPEGGVVKVRVLFTGDVNFELEGYASKVEVEDLGDDYGIGFIERSDIGTDIEGFELLNITKGQEYWDAYCTLDFEGEKKVEYEIID